MKFNSTSKSPGVKPKEEEKLFENIIDNLGKPKVSPKVKPKKNPSGRDYYQEFVDNGGKKLPIVSPEDEGQYVGLRPKPFDGYNNLGPDQLKKSFQWEKNLNITKNPKDKYQREIAKQTRQEIKRIYDKPKIRKYLGDDELRLVGKHPDQQKRYEIPKVETPFNVEPYRSAQPTKVQEYVNNKARYQPGISEDLLRLTAEVNKNMKYVMGEDQKEIESEELGTTNDNNYKEDHDR